MKKLLLVFAWTCGSVLALIANGAAVGYLLQKNQQPITLMGHQEPVIAASVARPAQGEVLGTSTTVGVADARVQIVTNFLRRHESPLDPDEFGKKLVAIADRYNIDFRLLPAISMQESNLCKKIPPNTYNCLGFGIHERGTLAFDSYDASFERAGRELKKNYIDEGRTTPDEIMAKYTPHSNGSWAASVNQWMAEMRYDDRQKGRDLKTEADVLEFTSETASASASPSATATP